MIHIATILPHSPLIHAGIGADVKQAVRETVDAVEEAIEDIYATHPDTIVLISDQPISYAQHLTVHIQDPIHFDLSAFGDFSMRDTVLPDLHMIDQIQRTLRKNQSQITLDSVHALHFSAAIPLSFVLKRMPNVQLVAIAPPSDADPKDIYEMGRAIQEVLMHSSKRIAIIAAGDGSHALGPKSPSPATKEGKKFDEYMQHILANRNASSLLSLDETLVAQADQAMYAQTVLLFGILHGIQTSQKLHSYESPFGVGYFVSSYYPL